MGATAGEMVEETSSPGEQPSSLLQKDFTADMLVNVPIQQILEITQNHQK